MVLGMNTTLLFDRRLVKWRKQRFATQFNDVDFLFREAAERLADRLEDTTRHFEKTLLLGNHASLFHKNLPKKMGEVIIAESFLSSYSTLLCDEEQLPFANDSFDATISCLSLQWVNDLPGALIQIQRALKEDGLFLAVLPGPQTLRELRSCLEAAMLEVEGGIYPIISPFVEVRDAGNLLQRAGFALPVADSESIAITYDNPFKLMKELRLMGEGNALLSRKKYFTRREIFVRAAEIYHKNHLDKDGRIIVTVELVFLLGWKPHASQQQPLKRGSGNVSLIKALE